MWKVKAKEGDSPVYISKNVIKVSKTINEICCLNKARPLAKLIILLNNR